MENKIYILTYLPDEDGPAYKIGLEALTCLTKTG